MGKVGQGPYRVKLDSPTGAPVGKNGVDTGIRCVAKVLLSHEKLKKERYPANGKGASACFLPFV